MIGLLLLAAAIPPSFDCARASHPLEKTICASAKLAALDADVAAAYRERLALIFDKAAFRGQQRDWQQILRTRCAKACDAAAVAADYAAQLANLRNFAEEDYNSNYKTGDVAQIHIHHIDARRFDFTVVRNSVDDESIVYCRIPIDDAGGRPIAEMTGPNSARWAGSKESLDFALKRDKGGAVIEIMLTGSAGTKRYCKDRRYLIDDRYIPVNMWVPSNQ